MIDHDSTRVIDIDTTQMTLESIERLGHCALNRKLQEAVRIVHLQCRCTRYQLPTVLRYRFFSEARSFVECNLSDA